MQDFHISMIPNTGKNFTNIHWLRVTCCGWSIMELPNEASFLLPTVTMITVKMCFTRVHSSSYQEIMQPIKPNYNWENEVKQIKISEGNLSQSCILCQLLSTKTLASGSKCIKHISVFLLVFALCMLNKCDLFNFFVSLKPSWMGSLDMLCYNLLNLKNKITKIKHKKIFDGPSKILKYISWPIIYA